MIITSDFEVPLPVETVWRFFDDIPQVAACLPGASLTEDLGGGRYSGGVAIRMGPVRLNFAGTADIVSRDETAKKIVVDAAGADAKGRGNAAMTVTAALSAVGGGSAGRGSAAGGRTKVSVTQDLRLSGAAAQYGRGMITDFSAIMMRDFAASMADRIERLERGERPEQISAAAGASSVGGLTLATRAALLALTRVFRRLFLPYQPAA